ncbi:MAG: shikimate kinase [Alphaproteobacteria bacterium]|nr:shikimate kinase [Alphaproteobacteria bacterium]
MKTISDIKERLQKPVVFVGMMGSGKSHVGLVFARHLDLSFHDSDKIVEKRAGCSVSEIFEQFGEDKFRSAEQNAIFELLKNGPAVISTGGGALLNAGIRHAIQEKAISIWLKADISTLADRVGADPKRPLLAGKDPSEVLADLMKVRIPLYEQADITIDTTGLAVEKTVEASINGLCEFLNKDRF